MKWVTSITRVLERTSPSLARAWAKTLFFRPARRYKNAPQIQGLSQRGWVLGKKSQANVFTLGNGPKILLIHGWAGAAQSFENMARTLDACGFQIVTFDGPAHGTAPGKKTNLIELSEVARDLDRVMGPFEMVIGHSFGGVVAAHAIRNGLRTQALVTVGSPASTDFILSQFKTMIGASERTKHAIGQKIESIAQQSLADVSLKNMIAKDLSGLILHDKQDKVVPPAQAIELKKHWPQAQTLFTDGLGHSGILRDAKVIENIVTFAQSQMRFQVQPTLHVQVNGT